MKYLILIYSNPTTRKVWDELSDAERGEGWQAYAAINEALTASGELIVSEALADPSLARRIAIRDGQAMATDGPFAEVKEQLAGFYLVDCDGLARAIEIAGQIPEASYGVVEVRPVMDLGGMEG